jgi:hypothetical protein
VDSHYRDCRSGKAGNQSYRSDLVAKPSGNRPLIEPGKPDLTAYDWSSVFFKKNWAVSGLFNPLCSSH